MWDSYEEKSLLIAIGHMVGFTHTFSPLILIVIFGFTFYSHSVNMVN